MDTSGGDDAELQMALMMSLQAEDDNGENAHIAAGKEKKPSAAAPHRTVVAYFDIYPLGTPWGRGWGVTWSLNASFKDFQGFVIDFSMIFIDFPLIDIYFSLINDH